MTSLHMILLSYQNSHKGYLPLETRNLFLSNYLGHINKMFVVLGLTCKALLFLVNELKVRREEHGRI